MHRHFQRPSFLHVLERGIDRNNGAVAFAGSRNVNSSLGDGDARLWPANKFRRLKRGIRQDQSHWISQAHILGSVNDDSPRDKARVLAGMNHFRQPI